MNNQYSKWHNIKNIINNKNVYIFPKEREVWVCTLGKNIGYEQNGVGDNFIRPCLVFKKFNNKMFWIIPMSSKQKNYDFYYNFIDYENKRVSIILSQLKLISINRFDRKMYELNLSIFDDIKDKIKYILK